MILRKGAVSTKKGEKLIVPINRAVRKLEISEQPYYKTNLQLQGRGGSGTMEKNL
jgi:hypothetical protein